MTMDGIRKIAVVVGTVAVAFAATARGQGTASWYNPKWRFRRSVSVPAVPVTRLPGSEIGVATIITGGRALPDGRDIRVGLRTGPLTPHRVLAVGPGDRVRVAFALKPTVKEYFIYFGNAAAGEPPGALALEIRRGVLMESFDLVGRGFRTLRDARRLFDRADKPIGSDFRPSLFLGHNPFGPQLSTASRFTAYVIAPAEGEYAFAVASTFSAALIVDGKELIVKRGTWRVERNVRYRANTPLSKGLHKIELLHVNMGRVPPAVVVAWKKPGGQWDRKAIPPEAFAPVVRAEAGPLREYGTALTADYSITHAGEAFAGSRYYQRYVFDELTSRGRAAGMQYRWDFGDGQSAEGRHVEHVYLSDGLYKVTLTVTGRGAAPGGKALTRVNRLRVWRNWDRVIYRELDPLGRYAEMVAGYDLTKLSGRDLLPAAVLFDRTGKAEAMTALGESLLAGEATGVDAIRQALPILARHWRGEGKLERIVSLLEARAKRTADADVAIELLVLAGEIAREELKAPDKALAIGQQALAAHGEKAGDRAVRLAWIGIGNAWRAKGDYDKAKAAYERAGPAKQGFQWQTLRRGDCARHVEEYLRTGALDDAESFLNQWEADLPLDRLIGYSTLMRVRLLAKRRRPADVVAEVAELVKVAPGSLHAPQLLLEAEIAYRATKQPDRARAMLEKLVTDYPESALAADAKRRLASPPD